MIDKKDARYGNLVYDKFYEQVRPLGVTDLYNIGMGNSKAEELLPIELNEDWMKRIGKEWDLVPGWKYKIQVGALNWFFRWNTEWYSELGGIYLGSRFQHIHQIQNIFLDLTGKELTIKEPINEPKFIGDICQWCGKHRDFCKC